MNTAEHRELTEGWRVAAGSVRGRDHALSLRNNQDGFAVRLADGLSVAVVTDGCSSGAANEAGARLGAEVLANAVVRFASDGLDARLTTRACDRLFAWLYESARAIATGETLAPVIERFFLFTFLCAVTRGDESMIFGVGDGVVGVDGRASVIDSGPENAPPYLGYRALGVRPCPHPALRATLSGGERADVILLPEGEGARRADEGTHANHPASWAPVLHHHGRARSLLIATDGFSGALAHDAALPRQWTSDRLTFDNPAHLGRQLVLLADQRKWLRDDTTVALLERG